MLHHLSHAVTDAVTERAPGKRATASAVQQVGSTPPAPVLAALFEELSNYHQGSQMEANLSKCKVSQRQPIKHCTINKTTSGHGNTSLL